MPLLSGAAPADTPPSQVLHRVMAAKSELQAIDAQLRPSNAAPAKVAIAAQAGAHGAGAAAGGESTRGEGPRMASGPQLSWKGTLETNSSSGPGRALACFLRLLCSVQPPPLRCPIDAFTPATLSSPLRPWTISPHLAAEARLRRLPTLRRVDSVLSDDGAGDDIYGGDINTRKARSPPAFAFGTPCGGQLWPTHAQLFVLEPVGDWEPTAPSVWLSWRLLCREMLQANSTAFDTMSNASLNTEDGAATYTNRRAATPRRGTSLLACRGTNLLLTWRAAWHGARVRD